MTDPDERPISPDAPRPPNTPEPPNLDIDVSQFTDGAGGADDRDLPENEDVTQSGAEPS